MKSLNSNQPTVELFFKLWGALPPHFIRWTAKWAGLLWYKLDQRHRQVAESNIRLALGRQDERTVQSLAKDNFIHIAQVFLEMPIVASITAENCKDFVTVRGMEFLQSSMELGKGVFYLSGHIGNWEWQGYVSPFFVSNRLNVVARPLSSNRLNRLLSTLRERSGNRIIDKKDATHPIFRALQQNEMVAVLLDQNSSRGSGIYAPFFGVYALTHRALAVLAIKSGAPVHPVFNWRESSGKYCIEVQPAIPIPQTGSLNERVYEATALFNSALEAQIRRHPSQWFWVHRRFKHHRSDFVELN